MFSQRGYDHGRWRCQDNCGRGDVRSTSRWASPWSQARMIPPMASAGYGAQEPRQTQDIRLVVEVNGDLLAFLKGEAQAAA